MIAKLKKLLGIGVVYRWQNYSYTTKTVIVNGEEVTKYDRIKQVCGNTGKVRYIKGD